MLLMLSVVLLLLLPLAAVIVAQPCTPQQFFNPGGNASDTHFGGSAYRQPKIFSQTITLTAPSIVTALSLYPFSSFNGTFSVSAGLFTAMELVRNGSNPTVYATAQLLAQSAVNTTVNASYPDYRYTGQLLSPTPLSLPLPSPLSVAAGNYSLVWWFSFSGVAMDSSAPDFFPFVTCDECSQFVNLNTEGSQFNFTQQNGVFPDSFNHTQLPSGGSNGSPGFLVSLTATQCAVDSSSSSSGGELSSSGSDERDQDSSSNTTAIAISIVAVLAVIAIVVALCVLYKRRKGAASTTASGLAADRESRLLADEQERAGSDRYGEYTR